MEPYTIGTQIVVLGSRGGVVSSGSLESIVGSVVVLVVVFDVDDTIFVFVVGGAKRLDMKLKAQALHHAFNSIHSMLDVRC